MRWSEFAARQRRLAVVAEDQLIKPGVLLIGTIRRDRSARISGVEPLLMDGDLWLSMMPEVTYIGHDAGSNAQHVARWPAGEEYLRPSLTPTSLGRPEPVRRLLTHDNPA